MRRVETAAGPVVGRPVHEGVWNWRGIPYAAPPVGERRFRPAEEHSGWSTALETTEFGARAVQPPSILAPGDTPSSEDCLTLNVWAPEEADGLPVMVWIHGGGFTTGSADIGWYDGSNLARRGVVVVTLNYRLGPLGFLHLGSLDAAFTGAANAGLSDQAMALRWVRDNIVKFGGDPSSVTLFGESAGAMSLSAHLGRPGSAGLFHRAIAQSGAARLVQTADHAEAHLHALAAELGIPADPEAFLAVSAATLAAATPSVDAGGSGSGLALPYMPTVDGSSLPIPPIEAIASGLANDVTLVSGTNANEMALFHVFANLVNPSGPLDRERLERRVGAALRSWGSAAGTNETISAYEAARSTNDPQLLWTAVTTDTVFRMPSIEMCAAHSAAGGTTYAYEFHHPSTAFGGSLGAAHAVEIPFVFDNLSQPGADMLLGEITPTRQALADRLAATWCGIARHGHPKFEGVQSWPRYEAGSRATLCINEAPAVLHDPEATLRTIWLDG
jgi:para-nitrobenzyl esterase